MRYIILSLLLSSILILQGCATTCEPPPPSTPIEIKPKRFPLPERNPLRKFNESYGPYETKENARASLYNIIDDQVHICNLLEVIRYYEISSEEGISKEIVISIKNCDALLQKKSGEYRRKDSSKR